MSKRKLYLLGGNGSCSQWWQRSVVHFEIYEPVPVELPGSGNNTSRFYGSYTELARSLLQNTESGNHILACGINSLTVLHSIVLKPDHFDKIILLAPEGAFLWKKSLLKIMSLKPVRKISHFLLSTHPKLFRKNFTDKVWDNEVYRTIKKGFKNCRAFGSYFEFTKPYNALDLFDWIDREIHIIVGNRDRFVDIVELGAWDSILKRADLKLTIQNDWGHYPYFDDPEGFAKNIESVDEDFFYSHTKAGRLRLAMLAGLNVPGFEIHKNFDSVAVNRNSDGKSLYAVRSSFGDEDKADSTSAGKYKSYIRVKPDELTGKAKLLFEAGADEVIVQEFIEPVVSGVAFVRKVSAEIEWVNGHLETLTNGGVTPYQAVISKMENGWQKNWNQNMDDAPFIVMIELLNEFLQNCISKFHFEHSDIEWAWDGKKFYLLQIRPVTSHNWRRLITSANLDEILPKGVSRLMFSAQTKAAKSIGTIYSLWDERTLEDNEPFTSPYANAHYINSDLFLSRFKDWGLPASLFFKEIGGFAPEPKFSISKFLRSIPMFIKMIFVSRKEIRKIFNRLLDFEDELTVIIYLSNEKDKERSLVVWFIRYYLFIVRTNIILKACLSSSGGGFIGYPESVYSQICEIKFPHRVRFESDPAAERDDKTFLALKDMPDWNIFIRIWDKLGLPGMRGRYTVIREWFRDNNMKLFQRLHFQLTGSDWFKPSGFVRSKTGTFWQDTGEEDEIKFTDSYRTIIYPGWAEGIAGTEILIVDAIEPGHYEDYKKAKAIVAKAGGRLSHGATLLRELKIPSAINSNVDTGLDGEFVEYLNGEVTRKT